VLRRAEHLGWRDALGLPRLADVSLVMNAGVIVGELPIGQCSEAALGRLMGGAADARQAA
jgi:hypothetical protein